MKQYLVNKSAGTIQEFPAADDTEAKQIRQALNLDKQLYAQRGEEFGDVYDAETLPDEYKVKAGIMTQAELDEKTLVTANALKVAQARQYLADTDYKIIKQAELGEFCPSDILTKRAECRAIINKLGV